MATKAEMDAVWAGLHQRLGNDPGLLETLESIDKTLPPASEDDQPRRRLKVPYANTTSLDNGDTWN